MVAPGVYDALSAKIAQAAGLSCLVMGGYAVSASRLAMPDVGLLSETEMAESLKSICCATDIPVIADADTGYGNPLNVIRTEQDFEMAGASCIFFEDQAWPKRCGHMDGKQVIPAKEHAQKIRAACDARTDRDTVILARTDARSILGFAEALDRAKRYADSGAEIIFIEALQSTKELEDAAKAFEGSGTYLWTNMIEGGKTPILTADELSSMGYSGVFWPCSSLYTIAKALYSTFSALKNQGTTLNQAPQMMQFSDFNQFVGFNTYKTLEKTYAE